MGKIRNKRQSMLEGAAVLVIATGIVKVLGAIFKIPLGNLIGELGMGYFQTAYDLYLPVYSIALAGMPIAVCRMVAESVAAGRYNDTRRILKVARKTFTIIGIVACVVLIAVAYPYLSLVLKQTNGLAGVFVIAPSIICCCIVSAYRGYYQGLFNMNVTAVTEIIEAVGKLIIGLLLAFIVKQLGGAAQYQAAAAIMGITVGTFFSVIYTSIRYKFGGDGIRIAQLREALPPQSEHDTLKALLKIAVPVVIGSLATQIASIVDVMTVQSRLLTVATDNTDYIKTTMPDMWNALLNDPDVAGVEAKAIALVPTYLYGCFKGFAFSVYNLMPTITSMLGVSSLPAMTTAWASRSKREVRKNYEMVIRVAALLSLPAGFGITALGTGIMNLLYPSKPIGAAISGPILSIFGIAVIFCGISMPMTSLLQAIGKERIPVYNLIVGAVIKIISNYILVGIPSLNVRGAAIGTLLCYIYICLADFWFLCKYTKILPNPMSTIIKPLIASALCGIAAWASSGLISKILSERIATVAAILIALIVYAAAVLLLKVISKDDLYSLPKGEKLVHLFEKMHWL